MKEQEIEIKPFNSASFTMALSLQVGSKARLSGAQDQFLSLDMHKIFCAAQKSLVQTLTSARPRRRAGSTDWHAVNVIAPLLNRQLLIGSEIYGSF